MPASYDVLVVGGGHAGCEAALAAARIGARTALVTLRTDSIARMSCNPSVGGIAKSHIVFELDALGGEMARNADYTGIQFRVLNTKKGPAVRSNRVQCDKDAYARRMTHVVSRQARLDVIETSADDVVVRKGKACGIVAGDRSEIAAATVVLAPGTFLRGMIHVGCRSFLGGRKGEPSSGNLSLALQRLGFKFGRLKTGTPPRLHRDSLDLSKTLVQDGMYPPPFLSAEAVDEFCLFHVEHGVTEGGPSRAFHMEHQADALRPWTVGTAQIPCYLTHTNPGTHRVIRDNLLRSSLYGGHITGTGVRYCPSIEDKVVKFPAKESHHVFLEPEGMDSVRVYPNGTSNSLPEEVQVTLIRSIRGLEHAQLTDYGYAVEYDFSDPTKLMHTLETKIVEGLFMAGQINGTTGYEEAAGQGFVAGVNAARKAAGLAQIVISRFDGYVGVMIDDLVTKGTDEPYRMFTSRAEHRLIMRQDNAMFRMLPFSKEIGIISKDRIATIEQWRREVANELERLSTTRANGCSLAQRLRRPEAKYEDIVGCSRVHPRVAEQVELELKYAGYIARETEQASKSRQMEGQSIPDWIDYDSILQLRFEAREKLSRIQPETLGQASRIPGVTPSDVSLLTAVIARGRTDGRGSA